MRITGGILGGRRIEVPGGPVRPTQDKVRQALFSSLGARVPGCRFLDLFAGSGAVGLEAWSRGAAQVCWVESDRRALAVLRGNVRDLCGASEGRETRIVAREALRFLRTASGTGAFDIVFADPPYDPEGRFRWADRLTKALEESRVLRPAGLLVLEQSAREALPAPAGWRLAAGKEYGETRLVILEPPREED